MTDENPDTGVIVDATARTIGLEIAPAHRAGVIMHYQRALAIVAPLLALDLDDDIPPAPVFSPEAS